MEEAINRARHWTSAWSFWINQKDTHVVKYEDLRENPVALMVQMVDFLGLSLMPEAVREVVVRYVKDPQHAHRLNFYKGTSGRYKTAMTADQIDYVNLLLGRHLEQMGYRID